MKRLIFTVTNDLTYDQRMIRICTSLAESGYHVTLIGRASRNSLPLQSRQFVQERLNGFFAAGFLFYIEYNIRLFFVLLFKKADLLCAIDLDTILPVYFVSFLRNKKRVYDAHELFCEMKEVVSRPAIYKVWKRIEQFAVPKFSSGYTVNEEIATEFNKMYRVHYKVVRNMPLLTPMVAPSFAERYVLYQGAVNEGRSFETLIPAFKMIDCKLIICGDGNFMQQARELATNHGLDDKIIFTGKIRPDALIDYTRNATIGITLFDKVGMSNYYSLANRFFDYMHAGVPQVCVNYPVYRPIVEQYPFALLITDLSSTHIAKEINHLLEDKNLYCSMKEQCLLAREVLNWQQEEKQLILFYKKIFGSSE